MLGILVENNQEFADGALQALASELDGVALSADTAALYVKRAGRLAGAAGKIVVSMEQPRYVKYQLHDQDEPK